MKDIKKKDDRRKNKLVYLFFTDDYQDMKNFEKDMDLHWEWKIEMICQNNKEVVESILENDEWQYLGDQKVDKQEL